MIERVEKVSSSEEVHTIPTKETTILSFQDFINTTYNTAISMKFNFSSVLNHAIEYDIKMN